MIRADLWLQFTGLAYGFETVVDHASLNFVQLRISSEQNAYDDADSFALFQDVLSQPQNLKNIEIRILPMEKLALEPHKEFLTLVTHRVPRIVNGSTPLLTLAFSDVIASNPADQLLWSRFVERAFASQRI